MMKRFLMVLVLAACGGKIEEGSDLGASTSSGSVPGTTPTGTSTAVPPSAPTPGKPPSPSDPGDPKPPSTKTLTAVGALGGLDRVFVFAADPVANSCVRIELTSPTGGGPNDPYPNVLMPKQWRVDDIARWPDASKCSLGKQPPPAENADDAKGTITFVSKQVIPCSIDVHVAAIFAGKPTVEAIDGDKIPVSNCQ